MSNQLKGILSQEHLELLNKVLASIPQAIETCKACEDCGIDVSEFRERFEQQQKMAAALKAKFFPLNN